MVSHIFTYLYKYKKCAQSVFFVLRRSFVETHKSGVIFRHKNLSIVISWFIAFEFHDRSIYGFLELSNFVKSRKFDVGNFTHFQALTQVHSYYIHTLYCCCSYNWNCELTYLVKCHLFFSPMKFESNARILLLLFTFMIIVIISMMRQIITCAGINFTIVYINIDRS